MRRVHRHRVIRLMAAAAAGLALAGCSTHGRFGHDPKIVYPTDHHVAPIVQIGRPGGNLTYVSISDPKTFNLWVADDANTGGIIGELYDSLEVRDSFTLKFVPRLASLPKISADGLTYTYTLRPNLKWSDGVPLTTDDVIFTLDMMYDPNTQGPGREGLLIDVDQPDGTVKREPFKYTKIDDRTVKFVLPTRWAPAESVFGFAIAPKHILEASYKAGKFNSTWGVDTPVSQLVSCGPLVMSEYIPSQRVVFKPNPYFWRRDAKGGKMPYLNTFRYLITPDFNATVLNFRGGGSDVLSIPSMQYPTIARYADRDNYTVVDRGPSWGFGYLCFNQNPTSKLSKDLLPLFQDKRFRQAVSYAIDRERICNNVSIGLAKPLYGPETPADTVYYDPNVKTYPYDPAKAAALLMQIPGVAHDGESLTYKGKPIVFSIMTAVESPAAKAVSTIIQGELHDLGMNVAFAPVAFNDMIRRMDAPPYDWEAAVGAFTGGPEPNDGSSIWRSSGEFHPWNPKQKTPATDWEARIDRDFTNGAHTIDPKQRKKYYDDWQEIMGEQQPIIFISYAEQYSAIRNHYGNIEPSSLSTLGGDVVWNIEEIYDTHADRPSLPS